MSSAGKGTSAIAGKGTSVRMHGIGGPPRHPRAPGRETFQNRPHSEGLHAVCWIGCTMMKATRAYKISVLDLHLRVFLLLAKSCS